MKFWKKRIKSTKNLASALNEDEEKVKALKDGNLEIGGKTMDRVLDTLEKQKIEDAIKNVEIWKWIQETDFAKKRKEFGYLSQTEVARKIGCHSSVISNLENAKYKFKGVSRKLVDVYNFYTNDFNKKIPTVKQEKIEVKEVKLDNKNKSKKKKKKNVVIQVTKANKYIWDWYKKTDIKALRLSMGYSGSEISKLIGVSQPCVSDLELKRCKYINTTMINAYNFYNNANLNTEQIDMLDNKILKWINSVDLTKLREEKGLLQKEFSILLKLPQSTYAGIESENKSKYHFKRISEPMKVIYKYYNQKNDDKIDDNDDKEYSQLILDDTGNIVEEPKNEENVLPEIKWEPNENNLFAKNTKDETEQDLDLQIEILERKIKCLTDAIKEQNETIERYKKIIDKLVQL